MGENKGNGGVMGGGGKEGESFNLLFAVLLFSILFWCLLRRVR